MMLKNCNKILLIFVIVHLISACGFSPMYAESSNNMGVTNDLDRISISIIPNREGQFLRNALIDRFYINGEPSNPRYALRIKPITEKVFDFDITVDSEATRRQLKLTSYMTLVDLKTGEPALNRKLLATTSHNVLESEFSTLVTEQSAREAALNDLARQIERQIALYLAKS